MRHEMKGSRPQVTIIDKHDSVLPQAYPAAATRRVEREAERLGMKIVARDSVAAVRGSTVHLASGTELPYDLLVLATGPAAHALARDSSDLLVDEQGYIRVRSTMQTTEFDHVFACGDCASMDDYASEPNFPPKAGVYAVRHGPILNHNLEVMLRALLHKDKPGTLKPYRPQRGFLSLLTLGDERAIGCKAGLTFTGHWVWCLKDHIDRKWMRQVRRRNKRGRQKEDERDKRRRRKTKTQGRAGGMQTRKMNAKHLT